jgi:hypothetical protein
MLRAIVLGLIVGSMLTVATIPIAHGTTSHISKTIAEVQPPQAGKDCVYFRLNGVTEADPILPNNPYFALPRTHVGFKEIYAMMLAAYLGGTSVSAQTTGAAAGGDCGAYVAVNWLITP